MKGKLLLTFGLIIVMATILAVLVGAAEPVMVWDVSATEDDNVTASLYKCEDGSDNYYLTVSGTGNMQNWTGSVTSPWSHRDYRELVVKATIEDGVTSVGDYAFYFCSYLADLTVGNDVAYIGNSAFQSCVFLTSVTLPDTVLSIGDYAFYSCSHLESIDLGSRLTSIGTDAFYFCASLKSVSIPSTTVYIGEHPFRSCTSLTSIEVDESNTAYCDIDKNLYTKDGKSLIQYALAKDSAEFSVPYGVVSIEAYAFYGNDYLKDVFFPGSLISIGECAFSNCDRLSKLSIPSSTTEIAHDAFFNSQAIAWISVDESNPSYTSFGGNLYTKDLKTIVLYAMGKTDTSFYIPYGVTNIGDYAFATCDNLVTINIPDTVLEIGNSAFYACRYLKAIDIPYGVREIGEYAFANCFSAESLVVSDSVVYIDANAFFFCCELKSVKLGKNVTIIDVCAFYSCYSLDSIVIPSSVTYIGMDAFSECASGLTVYCEAEEQPSSWDVEWNKIDDSCVIENIVWGYYGNMMENIFIFKGYSLGPQGVAIGYNVDYEVLNKYEELSGKTLDIGMVLAPFDSLDGNNPLDAQSNAITLESGKVIKAPLNSYNTVFYDLILTSVTDDLKDVRLAIAAYICNGTETKYVQANGLSDTVTGISYNEMYAENTKTFTDEQGFVYQLNSGELSVIGLNATIDNSLLNGLYIPYTYKGYRVTSISDRAFSDFGKLFSASKYANYQSGFVTMYIPTTIESIGDYAFENCSGLLVQLYNEDLSDVDPAAWDKGVTYGAGNKKLRDVIWGFRPALGWSRYSSAVIPDDYE